MQPMVCPKCGNPIPHNAGCCPECGFKTGWKQPERQQSASFLSAWAAARLRRKTKAALMLGIFGISCAILMPSLVMRVQRVADRLMPAELQEPVARIKASVLAKEGRSGQSALQNKTVIAEGIPVKAQFEEWPMYIRFEGGMFCRLTRSAAEEAVNAFIAADGKPIAVIGIVKGDGRRTHLDKCRVYAPKAAD